MSKKGQLKVGDWVKYRAGGPMLAHDVIGEVAVVAGYIDLLVHDKTVAISPADMLEVRRK